MTKNLFLVALIITISQSSYAQTSNLTKAQTDSIRFAQLEKKKFYPLISKWGAVIPTEVTYQPNTEREYKLLFELIYGRYDSVNVKNVNSSLAAMARIVNLHAASGISKTKMSIIGVVHNNGLDAFLHNEKYKEKYGVDNPSLPLISEYLNIGVRFIACGQTIEMNGLSAKDLIPELKIALTAQTVLSEYLGQGFVQF